MTAMWHAGAELLERYAGDVLDDARASSVEAHLLECPACRAELAGRVKRERLERIWGEVVEVVDSPAPGLVERALVALGVPEHVARLLTATPALRLSWFGSEAIALAFAAISAGASTGRTRDSGLLLFMTLAVLLPVAGVAAAYGPGVDPTYDVGMAAPMRSFRLLLIRAAAVLGSSTLLAAAAALALPGFDWTVVAWLLPSLGLTLGSLALATYIRPLSAAGMVASAWIGASAVVAAHRADRLLMFRGGGQVAFLLLIAISALVIAHRREAFEGGITE